MQFAMMRATEWYRILITDLAAKRAGLSKRQVMGVRRLLGADETRLGADECEMLLVAVAHGLCEGELAPTWAAIHCRGRLSAPIGGGAMPGRAGHSRRLDRCRIGNEIN